MRLTHRGYELFRHRDHRKCFTLRGQAHHCRCREGLRTDITHCTQIGIYSAPRSIVNAYRRPTPARHSHRGIQLRRPARSAKASSAARTSGERHTRLRGPLVVSMRSIQQLARRHHRDSSSTRRNMQGYRSTTRLRPGP